MKENPRPNCVLGCGVSSFIGPRWTHAEGCPDHVDPEEQVRLAELKVERLREYIAQQIDHMTCEDPPCAHPECQLIRRIRDEVREMVL